MIVRKHFPSSDIETEKQRGYVWLAEDYRVRWWQICDLHPGFQIPQALALTEQATPGPKGRPLGPVSKFSNGSPLGDLSTGVL